MSKESIEDLRDRLLRDSEIQHLIRMRAYEIYKLRGGEPGHQAEDWLRAEGEILQYLLEEEARRNMEMSNIEAQAAHAASAVSGSVSTVRPTVEQSPQPSKDAASAQPSGSIGVWSATEPHSATLAPPVGNATEFQIDAPKKSRSRASSKPASVKSASTKTVSTKAVSTKPAPPRKTKAEKPIAEGAAKKPARRALSKKVADSPAKSKKSSKKTVETSPDNQ